MLDVSEQEKAARKQREINEREEKRRLRFMDEEDKRRAYQRKLDEELELAVREIVLIKGDGKDRGQWKMGVIQKLVKGRGDVIREAILKTGSGVYERPLQLLYPMELYVLRDIQKKRVKEMNPNAKEFQPRAERVAKKTKARKRLEQLAKTVQDEEQ